LDVLRGGKMKKLVFITGLCLLLFSSCKKELIVEDGIIGGGTDIESEDEVDLDEENSEIPEADELAPETELKPIKIEKL
jgi:hypothetical protein